MEEKAGPQRGKKKRDTEHCSQEQCLNYVRFDEDRKPVSARDTQKLVALYYRVNDTAPWLYYDANKVQQKQEAKKWRWVMQVLCYLFAIDMQSNISKANCVIALCGFLGSAVKAKWKEIIASTMTLSMIAILGIVAAERLITDILEYIFANEYLVSLCSEGLELVEVIIKLDAFPVAGGNCFLMTLTLGNFGNACKDSWLHFLAAITACNDKNYDIVAQVVKNNFAIIDLLTAAGEIFIKALQKTVKIVF